MPSASYVSHTLARCPNAPPSANSGVQPLYDADLWEDHSQPGVRAVRPLRAGGDSSRRCGVDRG